MFILDLYSYVQTFFAHFIVGISVIVLIASLVSTKLYGLILKVFGIGLLAWGIFLEGAAYNENEWKEKLHKLEEAKVQVEKELEEEKKKIKIKIVKQIEVIKETEIKIKEVIKENQQKINEKCEVDPVAITILNSAAKKPQ